jgi:hypothetical protein
MQVTRVYTTRTARGPLFCPRCCWTLGRAESPAIGYLSACGGCKRGLRITETEGGALVVVVDRDARDAEFIALEP